MFAPIFGVLFFSRWAFAAHLPSNVAVCKQSDPGFNECVRRNIQDAIVKFADGNKELGINPLEPLFIKQMTASTNGSFQVDEFYDNMYMHGLTKSSIDNFKIDLDKCTIDFVSTSPKLNIVSDYRLKGKMSLFDVNSHGKADQTLEHLKIDHSLKCEKYTKDNKEYIRLTDYTTNFHDYNIILNFGNLMPGNKQLSDELNALMKENSNSIFTESKFNYERNYAEIFKQLANNVFSKVPFDEIFPK